MKNTDEAINISIYLQNIFNEIDYPNPSYIKGICFKTQKFKEELSKFYKIPLEKIKLRKINKSIDKIFYSWLGKNNNTDLIINKIYNKIGKDIKVYIPTKDSDLEYLLSGESNGLSGMFFVEETYFIECSNYIICLLLGNNE